MKDWLPEQSAGEIVSLVELDAAAPQEALRTWKALRPAARAGIPPDLLSANSIVIEVQDGDYLYQSVGAALVPAFGVDFSGQRLSDISRFFPQFGAGLRMLYETARAGREPLAYRGFAGKDMQGAQFLYYESVILPFGVPRIDHLLVVSEIVARDSAPLP